MYITPFKIYLIIYILYCWRIEICGFRSFHQFACLFIFSIQFYGFPQISCIFSFICYLCDYSYKRNLFAEYVVVNKNYNVAEVGVPATGACAILFCWVYISGLVQNFCISMEVPEFCINVLIPNYQDKIAFILLTEFSNSLSWMKIMLFWFKLHWNVFPSAQRTIS